MVRYWLRTSPAEVKSGSVLVVCLRHLTVFFFFFLFQKIASFFVVFLMWTAGVVRYIDQGRCAPMWNS